MFKRFKKNDNYFTIAVYAFVVVALLLLLTFAFINLNKINSFLGSLFQALAGFIYGFGIAYVCNPLYKKLLEFFARIEKKKPHPKLKKVLALVITYIVFFAVITLIMFAVIPALVENIQKIISKLTPENIENWINTFEGKVNQFLPFTKSMGLGDKLKGLFIVVNESGEKSLNFDLSRLTEANIYNSIVSTAGQVITLAIQILVGIVLSVYFLIHTKAIVAGSKKIVCALFKKPHYEKIIDFARYTDKTFGRFLVAKTIDSIIIGFAVYIVMLILNLTIGMPYPALIGVIIGVTNIIPFFGPFIGAIPSAIIILIDSESVLMTLLFVAIIIVVQQIDGNILGPYLIGSAINLTPIGVILGVTLSNHFFGLFGMIIGVPLLAVISYLFNKFINNKLKKKNLPSDTTLYEKPDVYNDPEFIKASLEIEAMSNVEHKEHVERTKEEQLQHEMEIKEVEEKIIIQKDLENTATIDIPQAPEENPPVETESSNEENKPQE